MQFRVNGKLLVFLIKGVSVQNVEQLIESCMKVVEEKEDYKKYLKESGLIDRRIVGK